MPTHPRAAYLLLIALLLSACTSALTPKPVLPPPKPIVFHQQVLNINARDVANDIAKTHPVATDFDARTNTVILAGRPDAVAAARIAIDQMDALPDGHIPTSVFFVMTLKNANAAEVAALMEQMNPKEYHVSDSVTHGSLALNFIIVDPKTNSLLIGADFTDQQKTRTLIDKLDEILKRP